MAGPRRSLSLAPLSDGYQRRLAVRSWMVFPPTMQPEPLLRVSEDEPLDRSIVGTRICPDRLIEVTAFDNWERFLEAKHVDAIQLPPACSRNYRCSGGERNGRKAPKRPCCVTEELHLHPVPPSGMLIEDDHNDIVGSKPGQDRLK